MLIGKPAPFVRAFVDAVNDAIRALSHKPRDVRHAAGLAGVLCHGPYRSADAFFAGLTLRRASLGGPLSAWRPCPGCFATARCPRTNSWWPVCGSSCGTMASHQATASHQQYRQPLNGPRHLPISIPTATLSQTSPLAQGFMGIPERVSFPSIWPLQLPTRDSTGAKLTTQSSVAVGLLCLGSFVPRAKAVAEVATRMIRAETLSRIPAWAGTRGGTGGDWNPRAEQPCQVGDDDRGRVARPPLLHRSQVRQQHRSFISSSAAERYLDILIEGPTI